MNVHTRLSAKGQIVVPKGVRDRLGWQEGAALEVIEHAGSITLQPVPAPAKARSLAEVFAAIDARGKYTGPRISDEDMHRAVREEALRRDLATRSPRD